jgi:hypothetical protein
MTRINIMFNIIYNHRIFHHQIRKNLFHLINQSNQRMLTRRHISCKNINPDINCMFNCNSCSPAGGTGGTGGAGGNWFN